MHTTSATGAGPGRWRQALSWAGGGAALGGIGALACGACAAALPLSAILGVAGGLGLLAGGLGFVLAGGSAVGAAALIARRRLAARRARSTAESCCARPLNATQNGHEPAAVSARAVKEPA
jgi:hypothetical protein